MTFARNAAKKVANMLKIAWFVVLICLHFSHGSDPQPEQIHLSGTGKERKVVKLKHEGNHDLK